MLAAHLAVQAQLTGLAPVALVDLDPDPGLARWFANRRVAAPAVVRVEPPDLAGSLSRLEQAGMAFVVLDLPLGPDATRIAALEASDFVCIATTIEPAALQTVQQAVTAVENAGKPFVFVVNKVDGAGEDDDAATAAVIALAQQGALATTIVPVHDDFAEALAAGETVMERRPAGEAAEAIAMLWEYLSRRMDRVLAEPPPVEGLGAAGRERRRYPRIPLHERAMLLLDDS
ncbi:MAG: hypothetical protein GVY28_14260, partial [Alphaproteobacteria bacterium]|nr:hypothetical protein [Alphaproteobacteria bacterium]